MQYIEIESEGYTCRYDFEPVPSTAETFNPNIIIPVEPRSSASESLDILSLFGSQKIVRNPSVIL